MPNIRHEVLIGAPADQVFTALTTSEGLSGWWTPEAQTTPTRGSVGRFPFGATYFKEMEVTDLDSPRHLGWKCVTGCDE